MSQQNINNNEATIKADKNTKLIVTSETVYKENYAPFSMIGMLNKKGEGPMDIFDRLFSVSKGAFRVFLTIKDACSDDSNLAVLTDLSNLTTNQMKIFRRHIAELRKVDLVVRITKGLPGEKAPKHTYMINPEYLKCKKYSAAQELWKWSTNKTSPSISQTLHGMTYSRSGI
jgi:hypothetical protein